MVITIELNLIFKAYYKEEFFNFEKCESILRKTRNLFMQVAMVSIGIQLRNQECLKNVKDFLFFSLTFFRSAFSFKKDHVLNKLVKNIKTQIIMCTHFTTLVINLR